jgi:hypothetical protein
MKILTFVDLHGNLAALKKLVEKARKNKVSAFICAGDISFFGAELHELVKKFKDTAIPLIIIPGNHETPTALHEVVKKSDFAKDIHGKTVIFESCLFFGCGGSKITPFSTPFELNDKEFENKLSKFRKEKSNRFVFVVHEPPYNTKLDYIDGAHVGSKSIRKFIEKYKPDYCICGHFHENVGKEDKVGKTKIINPGSVGKVIEI